MALKRTQVPFYGKRETRLVATATAAMKAGDKETCSAFHERAVASMRSRYGAYLANGRRKRVSNGINRHTPRGF